MFKDFKVNTHRHVLQIKEGTHTQKLVCIIYSNRYDRKPEFVWDPRSWFRYKRKGRMNSALPTWQRPQLMCPPPPPALTNVNVQIYTRTLTNHAHFSSSDATLHTRSLWSLLLHNKPSATLTLDPPHPSSPTLSPTPLLSLWSSTTTHDTCLFHGSHHSPAQTQETTEKRMTSLGSNNTHTSS